MWSLHGLLPRDIPSESHGRPDRDPQYISSLSSDDRIPYSSYALTRSGGSLFLVPILQDDRVDDLSAQDASPSEEFLAVPVKLLVIHHSTTFVTAHLFSPFSKFG